MKTLKCPTCESPNPKWHPWHPPAQGEVGHWSAPFCHDPWHKQTADEMRLKETEELPQLDKIILLAKAAAEECYKTGNKEVMQAAIERALNAQAAEHETEWNTVASDAASITKRFLERTEKAEAERDAAVAEALERAEKVCKDRSSAHSMDADTLHAGYRFDREVEKRTKAIEAQNCAIAIRALKPRSDMVSGWIPVSERLPPDCSAYAERSLWLVNNAGNVQVAYWYPEEERWVDFGDYTITRQVTHWMPLPAPPAAEADKGKP